MEYNTPEGYKTVLWMHEIFPYASKTNINRMFWILSSYPFHYENYQTLRSIQGNVTSMKSFNINLVLFNQINGNNSFAKYLRDAFTSWNILEWRAHNCPFHVLKGKLSLTFRVVCSTVALLLLDCFVLIFVLNEGMSGR